METMRSLKVRPPRTKRVRSKKAKLKAKKASAYFAKRDAKTGRVAVNLSSDVADDFGKMKRLRKFAKSKPKQSISAAAVEPSARARAELRGLSVIERDLEAAEGAFDLAQVTRLLNISRQAVALRVKEESLLAVPGPSNQRR